MLHPRRDRSLCRIVGLEALLPDAFELQGSNEGLGDVILPARVRKNKFLLDAV
jgi:hypothetical protein